MRTPETLEERVAAALARRGSLRIGQFISVALGRCVVKGQKVYRAGKGLHHLNEPHVEHDCAFGVPDAQFVAALEGMHAPPEPETDGSVR